MRVHDSQAYRNMDVARERISRIVELREILVPVMSIVLFSSRLCGSGKDLRQPAEQTRKLPQMHDHGCPVVFGACFVLFCFVFVCLRIALVVGLRSFGGLNYFFSLNSIIQ